MSGIAVAVVFNFLDLLSGFISAIKMKDINSSKLRDGVFKKVGFIFCYVLGYIVDNYSADIGFIVEAKILPVLISYAILTELCSIIENIHKINPDILPDKLLSFFNIKEE